MINHGHRPSRGIRTTYLPRERTLEQAGDDSAEEVPRTVLGPDPIRTAPEPEPLFAVGGIHSVSYESLLKSFRIAGFVNDSKFTVRTVNIIQ